MEGMLNDLAIGADTSRSFEEYVRGNDEARQSLGRMEFSVQVLTSGHWPTYKAIELNLPPVMMRCTMLFRQFHDANAASHKRLQWTHSLGTASVKGTFGKRSYDIHVSTLQAVALLAFNVGADSGSSSSGTSSASTGGARSFSSLLDALGMPEEPLKRVMHSLSCGKFKVLRKISAASEGGEGEKEKGGGSGLIKTTDSFLFNEQFR